MSNYYYLAMYVVTNNGNTIEDASFFIQSPQILSRQQIKDIVKEKEKYTLEIITLSRVIEIGEDMFKSLSENKEDSCFKIAEPGYEL